MKLKFLIITGLFLWCGNLVWAQGKLSDKKWKEFEAQKVAFFTQTLDLSPAEAAVFWPLYNEMFKKIRGQERAIRDKIKEMNQSDRLKEEQYREGVMYILAAEQKIVDIKKEYYQELMKVVPAQKISKLGWVEHKFHKQLLDKMRKCTENPK